MKRYILLIVMLFSFSVVLSACGDEEEAAEEVQEVEADEVEEVEEAPEPEPEPELSDEEAMELANEIYDTIQEPDLALEGEESPYDKYTRFVIEDAGDSEGEGEIYPYDPESKSYEGVNINTDHSFYKEMYEIYHPVLQDIVTDNGIVEVINSEFLLLSDPRSTTPFTPVFQAEDSEVVEKSPDSFTVTNTVSLYSGSAYEEDSGNIVYGLAFIKDGDNWKYDKAEVLEEPAE